MAQGEGFAGAHHGLKGRGLLGPIMAQGEGGAGAHHGLKGRGVLGPITPPLPTAVSHTRTLP